MESRCAIGCRDSGAASSRCGERNRSVCTSESLRYRCEIGLLRYQYTMMESRCAIGCCDSGAASSRCGERNRLVYTSESLRWSRDAQ